MFSVTGKKWLWFVISLVLIVPGLVFLLLGGLKPGIDFTGGSQLELRIKGGDNVIEALRTQASAEKLDLNSVVSAGEDHYLLRFKQLNQQQQTSYIQHLNEGLAPTEVVSFTSVGPTVSGELSWRSIVWGIALPLRFLGVDSIPTDNIAQALGGVFWASVAIALYIAYAFRKVPEPYSPWAFGVSAVISLLHDALLILGLFAILGHFWDIEIDTSFVTAVLTVIGFSVHDTIVVFDRVRENLRRHSDMSFSKVVDISVLETLARSVSTSLTVVLVLAAMFLFGGETIRWFVLALLVGIISGTYSSIFNASMVLDIWEEWRDRVKSNKKSPNKAKSKKLAAV